MFRRMANNLKINYIVKTQLLKKMATSRNNKDLNGLMRESTRANNLNFDVLFEPVRVGLARALQSDNLGNSCLFGTH